MALGAVFAGHVLKTIYENPEERGISMHAGAGRCASEELPARNSRAQEGTDLHLLYPRLCPFSRLDSSRKSN
jgi:hypothetical protein